MNYISTIINYANVRKPTLQEKREFRKENFLCLQCGGERPCMSCAARTRAWRKRQKK